MKRILFTFWVTVAVMVCGYAVSAGENSSCKPTPQAMYDFLRTQYSEEPSGMGRIYQNRGLLLIWRDISSGTWTVTITKENGETCMHLTGDQWRDTVPVLRGEPI